jgi:hypothetical protein
MGKTFASTPSPQDGQLPTAAAGPGVQSAALGFSKPANGRNTIQNGVVPGLIGWAAASAEAVYSRFTRSLLQVPQAVGAALVLLSTAQFHPG